MKNHTPSLSGHVEVELVKNPEERFPFWFLNSKPALVAASIPPQPSLTSKFALGKAPSTIWQDEQISKDWYLNKKSNTPHLQDMAPPENIHIAVNLEGRSDVVEGFVIPVDIPNSNEEGLGVRMFAEIVRAGLHDAAYLQKNIRSIAQGPMEFGAVELIRGEHSVSIDEKTVEGIFILHQMSEVIGWQYVYANGLMARPERSAPVKLVFAANYKGGKPVSFSFIEDNRGTIYRAVYEKETTDYFPKGHTVNRTVVEDPIVGEHDLQTNALLPVFQQYIQQYSSSGSQVEFYVTDPKSALFLTHALAATFENPMFWLRHPVVHFIPTWTGLYANPNKETKDCNLRRVVYLWQQMGLNEQYKERVVIGELYKGADTKKKK